MPRSQSCKQVRQPASCHRSDLYERRVGLFTIRSVLGSASEASTNFSLTTSSTSSCSDSSAALLKMNAPSVELSAALRASIANVAREFGSVELVEEAALTTRLRTNALVATP